MAKTKKDIDPSQVEYVTADDFLSGLTDTLDAQFKGEYAGGFKKMSEYEHLMPDYYISTGDPFLDVSISNRKNGGLPSGRFINIYGDSSSGKSLLCFKIVAEAQKRGGIAIYFDTERAVFPPFAKVLGVDETKMHYYPKVNAIEDIFKIIVTIVNHKKKMNFKAPFLIIIDSMKATNIKEVVENFEEFGDTGYSAGAKKQKLLGENLEKIVNLVKEEQIVFITVDQLRDNLNKANKYSPDKRSTSGNAQIFYSDIRIELKRTEWIELKEASGEKTRIGAVVRAEAVKNRIAPPFKKSEFHVYFTRGMDVKASWLANLKKKKIIDSAGAYIKFKDENGDDFKHNGVLLNSKTFRQLLGQKHPIVDVLYNRFCDAIIEEYEYADEEVFDNLSDVVEITNDPNEDDE